MLENHSRDIVEAARDFYKVNGRGFVNISLTNHPQNPYKTGRLYYVTEEDNNEMLSRLSVKTEQDILISEAISTYEPTTQAVVCFWYDTMCYVATLTDKYAVLGAAMKHKSLTVH